jgi:hypothetical protein
VVAVQLKIALANQQQYHLSKPRLSREIARCEENQRDTFRGYDVQHALTCFPAFTMSDFWSRIASSRMETKALSLCIMACGARWHMLLLWMFLRRGNLDVGIFGVVQARV